MILHRRSPDVPRDRLVEIGMLEVFARNHLMDAWLTPVVCLLVGGILSNWAPWPLCAAWFTLCAACVAAGHAVNRRFLAAAPGLLDPAPWRRRLLLARVAVIGSWSAMALLAWPAAEDSGRYFMMLVLTSTMALRIASSAAFPRAMQVQLVPPLLALLALCAMRPEPLFAGLAAAAVLYTGYLLRIGNQTGARIRQMFHLQLELLDAKEAADAANRAKSSYLATLSHEIRTPMTGMLGLTRLMLETQLSPRQREYVRTMHDSGEALLSILNDVLDLSKVEAGRMDIEQVDFDPRRLVEGVAGLMQGRAAEKGLAIEASVADAVPARLTGDPLRLRQVLVNLVGNAIKFTERGKVRITAGVEARGDGRVTLGIVVSDTGIGIPEEAKCRLFDAFAQADAGISRRYGGTGLGLAISHRLVGAMGGEIGFRSEAGQGSDFWFTVPLAVAEAVPEGAPAAPPAPDVPSLSILVAEDVPANQMVLEAFLRSRGHRVALVEDGAAAVAAVAEGRFDLVLMDMQMAGMDGLSAARRIRALADAERARVPIIATTANALSSDAARCRAAGMDGFVPKPILPERLFEEIQSVWVGGGMRVWEPGPAPRADGSDGFDAGVLDGIAGAMAPPDLEEFVRLSQEAILAAADRFARAVASRDAAAARHAAHTLRGTAANVGLHRLAERAGRAQAAARAEQWDAAEPLVGTLPAGAQEAAALLQSWLERRAAPAAGTAVA
ncbi:MAG TPA: ATP-binding protein [Azospirillaceae bacterium]|nr:ATP-binding protein [Azospirillaceae bacterium]